MAATGPLDDLKPAVGEWWKSRVGCSVHLLERACGPFPLIGRVFVRPMLEGQTLRHVGPLWAFSLDGVSCDSDDRGFDLVERDIATMTALEKRDG
jgi:hypothetical protein